MSPDPRHVKALFHAALDLTDPAQRAVFLDRECKGDDGLRHRLNELLAAHDHPASALERPLIAANAETAFLGETAAMTPSPSSDNPTVDLPEPGQETVIDASRPPTSPARTLPSAGEEAPPLLPAGGLIAGRYKIREEIGEGGMGSVYLADQIHPVKRRVALKLIKLGMDSRTVLARFEHERQALAVMDHAHIAKVLDAGTTDQGRPFFVMELVKGIPLTDYCDKHRLDLPARLALFRQICEAVQHAHQKGIIHRDLKPTNILVEDHDGKPVPKVIDFGLAKAVGGTSLSEETNITGFAGMAGTPLYMAPEQATFNALDVDTRADIYALGVILYELLTGSTPIQKATLKRAALDEMMRVIREDEPPIPSSRISSSEGLPSIAAFRHVEPAKLGRLVRGELDWIVMKALAKERVRRYDSAIGLANDVERYLNHEPVTAGPPSGWYRTRKFVRRHRLQVAAVMLIVLVLVGGIVGTTLGLLEARRQAEIAAVQRKRAERRLVNLMGMNKSLGFVFGDVKSHMSGEWVKVLARMALGDALNIASAELLEEGIGDPYLISYMQMDLSRAQLGLGQGDKGVKLASKAHTTLSAMFGAADPQSLASMRNLADAYQSAGRLDKALSLLHEYKEIIKRKDGPDSILYAAALSAIAGNLLEQKLWAESETVSRESLAIRDLKQSNEWSTFHCKSMLGAALLGQKRLNQAEPFLRDGYKGMRQSKLFHITAISSGETPNLLALADALDLLISWGEAAGKPDEVRSWKDEKAKLTFIAPIPKGKNL